MKYLKDNLKTFIIFIITIAISLILIEPITSFLKIGSVIKCDNTSFKTGFFSILAIVVFIYIYLINKRFIHNIKTSFLIFYSATLYFFIRCIFKGFIQFLPEHNMFVYADCIFIISILHFLNLISVWTKNTKKDVENNSSFFIEDKPFKNQEIDNEAILQKLINVVTNFKPEEAFSIGINAVWGYGKSSFLHRFKNVYTKENPREIIFWYRIWKNKGENAIIENFFDELKKQLTPYSGEISNTIDKYVNSILSLSNTDLQKIIEFGTDFLSDSETLESFYDDINTIINKVDRQVIILLDDLDRLETGEIMHTLKLIRTLSDFNNIIFIAGYDRKYVTDKIDSSKNNYLDKIFNVEINLLPFDSRLINDELFRIIDKTYPNLIENQDNNIINDGFKNLFKSLQDLLILNNKTSNEINIETVTFGTTNGQELSNQNINCLDNYNYDYQDFLPTYRDIKRFINEFKFNASFIEEHKADVIISEYILLKLLTYKYRDINTKIFHNIDTFFLKKHIDIDNERITHLGNDDHKNVYVYNKDKDDLKLLFPYYEDHEINLIHTVLCRLFDEKTNKYYENNFNSISKIYYTQIYLKNNILNNTVSITELQNALFDNKLCSFVKKIYETINLTNQYNLISEIKYFLFDQFKGINSKDKFLDVLSTLQFLLKRLNYNDNKKIIDFLNNIFDKIYSNDSNKFKKDITEIITRNADNGFIDYLLTEVNINNKRVESNLYDNVLTYDNFPLYEKDLKKIFLDKLTILIKNEQESHIVYSQYSNYVEAIVNEKRILFSSEANNLLKNDIKSRFPKYFNSKLFESLRVIIPEATGQMVGYSPLFSLAQIFSSTELLKDLIDNPQNENLYKRFYLSGWQNLYNYLSDIDMFDGTLTEVDTKAFKRAKKFLKFYINNSCTSLTKSQYKKVCEDDLPF